jgi:hypothetical protein
MGVSRLFSASILFLTLGISITLSISSPGEEIIDGSAILHEIEGRYMEVTTLSGNFLQVIPLKGMGITRSAKGAFFVQKPLKSRWNYTDPSPQTFITNGSTLFFRRGEEPYRKARMNRILLDIYGVILGNGGLLTEYFTQGRVRKLSNSHYEVELIPAKKFMGEVKRVLLFWDRERQVVEKVVIFSVTGIPNTLSFKNISINPPLPGGYFQPE